MMLSIYDGYWCSKLNYTAYYKPKKEPINDKIPFTYFVFALVVSTAIWINSVSVNIQCFTMNNISVINVYLNCFWSSSWRMLFQSITYAAYLIVFLFRIKFVKDFFWVSCSSLETTTRFSVINCIHIISQHSMQ